MSGLVAAVLAAGKGTRMKSAYPKVLHCIGGKPMVERVLAATKQAGAERATVVIGFGAEKVKEKLGAAYDYVVQEEQLGTGHAMQLAKRSLQDAQTVMVVCGDTPLLRGETLQQLVKVHRETGAAATVLTTKMPDPSGYGRIIRDMQNRVVRIVEQKDGTPEELEVNEVNTGTYCFESTYFWDLLDKIGCDNAQGEYYITDVIGLLVAAGLRVSAAVCADPDETLGVNSRVQLAEAEYILRMRTNRTLMDAGVTLVDPQQVYVDETVRVGADTILEPGTVLRGKTVVGNGCIIGPNTELADVRMGDGCHVHRVYAHGCTIADSVQIGPYVHLRPGTVIENDVRIGNFVEVKNSHIGEGTKLSHLSYLGDSDIGAGVNVGCGSITVNYDGKDKYRTIIEDGAFIGCNSNLIAPIRVGKRAYIGAGSTVTKDIPSNALTVGRAKVIIKKDWVKEDTFKK